MVITLFKIKHSPSTEDDVNDKQPMSLSASHVPSTISAHERYVIRWIYSDTLVTDGNVEPRAPRDASQHVRRKVSWGCSKCNMEFASPAEKLKHVNKEHRSWVCDECGKVWGRLNICKKEWGVIVNLFYCVLVYSL